MNVLLAILIGIAGGLIGGSIVILLRHGPSDVVDLIHWLFDRRENN